MIFLSGKLALKVNYGQVFVIYCIFLLNSNNTSVNISVSML